MKSFLYALSSLISVTYSTCKDQSTPYTCNAAQPPDGYSCCIYIEGFCSAASGSDCPSPAPTTSEPTPLPTDIGLITTACYCPTPAPVIITAAPTTKSGKTKKTKGDNSGLGIGECDCDGGLIEIRYIYQGTTLNVQVEIFYGKDKEAVLCTFNNVNPNDEIICDITGSGYSDFDKETPFVITYPNGGTCEGQYHTSCSQDIVGLVLPECTDLIVSGWRDVNTPTADCDDGKEPCDCDGYVGDIITPSPTLFTVDAIIGDQCYCRVDGCTPAPVTITKSGKTKSSSDGLGCGDCDCDKDYGMVELKVLYMNQPTVDIEFYDKDGTGQICQVFDIVQGQEVICNTNSNAAFDKFETDTNVKVIDTQTGAECETKIHTSCSSDIVGTYGDEESCGLLVTGWADGNPLTNDCDDGLELCSCDGDDEMETTIIYEGYEEYELPAPETTVASMDDMDICFCSNRPETAAITSLSDLTTLSPVTSKSKKKKSSKKKGSDSGFGFGYCDCDGGIQVLRFIYTNAEMADSITVFLDGLDSASLCTTNDVSFGQEIECTASPYADKLEKDTYIRVTRGNTVCEGSWHTSCSRDIIGYQSEGCSDVVVTGWSDNDSAGECDDGFEPCECYDPCNEYSRGCRKYMGCTRDPYSGVCHSISAASNHAYYQILPLIIGIFFYFAL